MKKIIFLLGIISLLSSISVSLLSSDFVVKNRVEKHQKIITETLKEKKYVTWFDSVGKYQAPTDYEMYGVPRSIETIDKQIESSRKALIYWQAKDKNRSFNFLIASYLAFVSSLFFSVFLFIKSKRKEV